MLFLELSTLGQEVKVGGDLRFKVSCNDKNSSLDCGFAVNLLEDKDDTENITFQFNPRGPKSKVVMNTRHHGKWGKETVLKDKDVVNDYFQNSFELRIHVKDFKKILVYLNGQLKTEFSCKTDITRVNYVCYSSNLSIE
ncbi:uncharacterized protein LOC134686112 [Mytilus trossulus]|uniref:uncharacterized protein LOC134686112 n=1 Tax=Mytilus trossulus TaxID=6551 RepID=UPI00300750D5